MGGLDAIYERKGRKEGQHLMMKDEEALTAGLAGRYLPVHLHGQRE